MPEPQTAVPVRIHSAQTPAREREAHWYGAPRTGEQHAFVGIRSACRRFTWQASWSIVGPIEAVDRGRACDECLVATGSTEAELHGRDGNR
jgi:hypothetical protein